MPWKAAGMEIKMAGAVLTGKYRNVFKECGYSEDEITKRVEQTFETIFMEKRRKGFTMKWEMTWLIWRIPETMMSVPKACPMG